MISNGQYEGKDVKALIPLTSKFIEKTVVFSANCATQYTSDYHAKCSRWISGDIMLYQMQNQGYFVVHTNTDIALVDQVFYMTVTVTFRMEG